MINISRCWLSLVEQRILDSSEQSPVEGSSSSAPFIPDILPNTIFTLMSNITMLQQALQASQSLQERACVDQWRWHKKKY